MKADEDLSHQAANLLRQGGHEVASVSDENLRGVDDRMLIDICGHEQRCLVTLDRDSSNPFVYRPKQYAGVVLIRLPAKRSSARGNGRPTCGRRRC